MGIVFGETQDYLTGPHTQGNFETAFTRGLYGEVVMWLQQKRPADLNILVHPFTMQTVKDHTDSAAWLGEPVPLKLGTLERADVYYEKQLAAGDTEAHLLWKGVCDLNPCVKAVAAVEGS